MVDVLWAIYTLELSHDCTFQGQETTVMVIVFAPIRLAQMPPQPGCVLQLSCACSFQGEESTVVIISMVRSNYRGTIGFLKSPNRSNVMLSRAKHGLYIIGMAILPQTSSQLLPLQ